MTTFSTINMDNIDFRNNLLLSYDTIDSWYSIVGVIINGILNNNKDDEIVVIDGSNKKNRKLFAQILDSESNSPNLIICHFNRDTGELLHIIRVSANSILNDDTFSNDLYNNGGILRLIL